jgi:predicted dehydrogenase
MNIGILGFAHGHVDAYCQRWATEPELGIHLAAGWDHDGERLKAAAGRYALRTCETQDELLAQDVDAVIIASETLYHADLVVKAAEAGKAIVVQKPLALTLEEADRIVDAISRTGVPFSMAWQMRVDPQNLEMKSLIDSGSLGRIYQVRRRHCLNFCRDPAQATSWHLAPKYNRDIFADDAAHAMDFIYWCFGMPRSVSAELGSLGHPGMTNDHAIAVFRYADGMMAEVSNSFSSLAGENTTEITAEKGSLVQNYGDAVSAGSPRDESAVCLKWMLEGDADWTCSADPGVESQGDRITALALPISEFLHGNREPIGTAEEGRDVLRMLLACYESNEKGQRVIF